MDHCLSGYGVYYHYTDRYSADQIKKSTKINQSTNKKADARYGLGVYLTMLDPQHTLEKLAKNNFDGQNLVKLEEGKFEAVFEIELSRSKVNAHTKSRDIHVYPGDLYFESADVKSVKLHHLDKDGKVTWTIVVK